MIKKQPATPLPWKQEGAAVTSGTNATWGVVAALGYDSEDAVAQLEDAAYIAHACNAYPQLVASLRVFAGFGLLDTAGPHLAARMLLVHLGELRQ